MTYTSKNPSESNFDLKFTNMTEFKVLPQPRQKKFLHNFYITFFSNTKVIFIVKPYYGASVKESKLYSQ